MQRLERLAIVRSHTHLETRHAEVRIVDHAAHLEARNLTFTGLGITEELLSPNLSGPLELLISTIHPGADSEYYTHDGAEAGLVMNGTLELWVNDEHYRLHAGDSFAFPSTTPHRCANHGKKPVKVLWVITPPHY